MSNQRTPIATAAREQANYCFSSCSTKKPCSFQQPQPQQQQSQLVTDSGNSNQHSSSSSMVFNSYPPETAQYEALVQNADLFWEKLQTFHHSFRSEFKIPTLGGKALDLHHLFIEVTSRGGLKKVIRERRWKEVVLAFHFPTTLTSVSFALRKYYLSLLYHFEQVYYFHMQVPSYTVQDLVNRRNINGSPTLAEGTYVGELPGEAGQMLQLGSLVSGTIDVKFDGGYIITVNVGSDQLNGVLYHVVLPVSQLSGAAMLTPCNRKRTRLALQDPSCPKSNRSGYNFFFAEHHAGLKPMFQGQERAISKKIGVLWSNLTEAERQIYHEKGMRHRERYKTEMFLYKSSYGFTHQ